MPHYRIYVTTTDGHVAAPPTVVECADDQEAIGKAAQLTNGKAVELWEGARVLSCVSRATKVRRLESKALTVLF